MKNCLRKTPSERGLRQVVAWCVWINHWLNTYPDREGIETQQHHLPNNSVWLNTHPEREGIET